MLKKVAKKPFKTTKINKNFEKPSKIRSKRSKNYQKSDQKGRKTIKNPIKNLNIIKNF